MTKKNSLFASRQIFIPIAALVLLALFNLILDPSFFKITLGHNSTGDPVLTGYLMTILDYGSEVAILAIGMTLVTAASGGYQCGGGSGDRRFRYPPRTGRTWRRRITSGTDYRGLFSGMCCSHAVWCL